MSTELDALLEQVELGTASERLMESELYRVAIQSRIEAIQRRIDDLDPQHKDKFTELAGARDALKGTVHVLEALIFAGKLAADQISGAAPPVSPRSLC